jgi:hypothetical protein
MAVQRAAVTLFLLTHKISFQSVCVFPYENGHRNELQGINMYIDADEPVTDNGCFLFFEGGGGVRVYNA